ncbi:MAG: SET domain-containing protein [Candidatus Hermodarchaeota archaeon]
MQTDIPYNYSLKNPIKEYAEVRKSNIHGFGLFAKKFIPVGTVWWHARPQDVLIITKDQFLKLDKSPRTRLLTGYIECLLTYAYYDEVLDSLIFCLDDSKFVNHSDTPNTGTVEEHSLNAITKKDIHPGEEITEDYSRYILVDWLEKYKKFFDPSMW